MTTYARWQRLALFATVFLTGTAVLIFEVGATRLLSPYYGASLYVLSSVLSTILGALSLGYYLGGRCADRWPQPRTLFLIIGIAGLSMLALLFVAKISLPFFAPSLGFIAGPLILSLCFFFIPAFLLGADSPYVIKLLTESNNTKDTGAVVGTVFFWSTVGSIVGSLLAGFWLIPHLGLIETMTATALVVTLWSTALFILFYRTAPSISLSIIIIISLTLSVLTLTAPSFSPGTLVYEREGYYSNIQVFNRTLRGTEYRFLKNGNNHSSAIIPGSHDVAFSYAEYALLYDHFLPAKNYLVLGGGAYTIPRHLALKDPNLIVDTVEIEPFLLPVAHEYFDLPESPNLRNYFADARVFLKSTTTTYDVVFSDVMAAGHFIPPHLSTVEFYQALKERLSPDGVIFLNYIGSGDTMGVSMTGSLLKTVQSVFPNLALVALVNPKGKEIQNFLFILRHEGKPITLPDTTMHDRFRGVTFAANSRFVDVAALPDMDNEVLFTDNVAPIEPLLQKQFRLHH